MKILAQAITAAPGGSATVLRDLVASWDGRDRLVVMCWRRDVAEMLRAVGVDVDVIPARSTAEALLKLSVDRRCIDRHRPDVVWSQGIRVPFGGPQALHLRDIGVFDRTHRATPRELARRARVRRDMSRVDCTVVNSETMAEAVRASTGAITGRRLEVVPNGLDLDAFLAVAPPEPARNRDLRILLPQSDHEHKRSELAAEVLGLVGTRLPGGFTGARLIVPGGSPHLSLRAALRDRGLSDRAEFVERLDRSAMAALYGDSDVVLLTSSTESFCNPAVEAAAAGRWCIAPPLPVLRETGGPMTLIARSADADDLASAVVRVAGSETPEDLVSRARSHARRFTAVSSAGALRGVLKHLVRR